MTAANDVIKVMQAWIGYSESNGKHKQIIDIYNNHKETPTVWLNGMSPREAMIWLSEEVYKPKFGDDFFGHKAVNNIKEHMGQSGDYFNYIFSDSGFSIEGRVVVEYAKPENVFLITLSTPDLEWGLDSRTAMTPDTLGIPKENHIHIVNKKDADFEYDLYDAAQLITKKRPLYGN